MPVVLAPRVRRGTLAALCAAAVLTLPACGPGGTADGAPASRKATPSASPSPFANLSGPQIATKALAATRGASSLTLTGDMPDPEGRIAVDVALDTKGDCAGTMSVNGQGGMTLVKTGPTVYLKYDEKMLRAQGKGQPKSEVDAAVTMLANRWVKSGTKDPDIKDLAAFCDLDELLSGFGGRDTVARKGKLATVDGQQALTLVEADGASTYTLYVATGKEPYLLKIVTTGKDAGTMAFSDFDRPVRAEAPADKDVVDLDG